MFTKVKTITSYAGHARFIAECAEEEVGFIPRKACADIPSPYAYSPSKAVDLWNGKKVVTFEVRHKRFEVFEVPADVVIFENDEDAINANFVK